MTAVIRRRIVPRGVLPTEELPPPSALFGDDEPENAIPVVTKPVRVSKVAIIASEEYQDFDKEDDVEEEVKPEPVVVARKLKAKKIGVNPIEDIMTAMRSGEAVMIKREGSSTYSVSLVPNDIIVSKVGYKYLKKGISGRQYWDEVLNPEFVEWSKKWNTMTYSEKLEYAEKNGIVWNRKPDNEKYDVMMLTDAVRKFNNIEKYKEQYRKRSARAKVKG